MKHLIAIIDQDIPVGATNAQVLSVTNAYHKQLLFLKEAITYPRVELVYLDNWDYDGKDKPMRNRFNYDLGLDIIELDKSKLKIHIAVNRISQVSIIGGNVTACLTDKKLPFNYYNFLPDRTHLVLDICYDYSIEMQDNMLNLCMWCNHCNIKYTSSVRALDKIKDKTYHSKLNHYPY